MAQVPRLSTPVFATVQYRVHGADRVRADLPERCVFARPADDGCRVHVDHLRQRKTGPGHPLAVVVCAVHPVARYTLYPPGFYPYSRRRVAPLGTTGSVLRDGDDGALAWDTTVFEAALDAATGQRWPEDSPAHDPRRRRTQGRHLEFAGTLLGVHPGLDDHAREQAATRLGVPTMALRAAAHRWSRSWRGRGRAVVAVLTAVLVDGSLLRRLLGAGMVGGLWVRPAVWDPVGRCWRWSRALPAAGRGDGADPTRAAARDPPTNSPDARGNGRS